MKVVGVHEGMLFLKGTSDSSNFSLLWVKVP